MESAFVNMLMCKMKTTNAALSIYHCGEATCLQYKFLSQKIYTNLQFTIAVCAANKWSRCIFVRWLYENKTEIWTVILMQQHRSCSEPWFKAEFLHLDTIKLSQWQHRKSNVTKWSFNMQVCDHFCQNSNFTLAGCSAQFCFLFQSIKILYWSTGGN